MPYPARKCKHTEAVCPVTHVVIRPDKHDCGYVDERNRLLPQAERIATTRADEWASMRGSYAQTGPAYRQQWVREFSAAMDQLWAERAAKVSK